jgi:uncharacterized membrane protein
MSGLLLGMVPSVWTCWFHSMATLPPWPVSTDFGTCSYQCFWPIVPLFPYIFIIIIIIIIYYYTVTYRISALMNSALGLSDDSFMLPTPRSFPSVVRILG